MTCKLIENIENAMAQRLENGFELPVALLCNTVELSNFITEMQGVRRHSGGSSNSGVSVISIVTSFGTIGLKPNGYIPRGVYAPYEPGEDIDAAINSFLYSKLDRELNDIVVDIIEDRI